MHDKLQDREFSGRVALVTGGSRGIGRAICIALAEQGANVAINYRGNAAAAEQARQQVRSLGVRCEVVQADVADEAAVAAMVKTVESELGAIDLLVTSAGVAQLGSHEQFDFATWQQVMRVNVDGTCLPVMAVKDGMIARGYGRIVCIASIAGLAARGMMLPYSTSKAAVIGFARSCAEAFAPAVRVNCVAPGLTVTDMVADMPDEVLQAMSDQAFLKRHGRAEEIAATATFLLSEHSSFITGQTLVADGGRVTLP